MCSRSSVHLADLIASGFGLTLGVSASQRLFYTTLHYITSSTTISCDAQLTTSLPVAYRPAKICNTKPPAQPRPNLDAGVDNAAAGVRHFAMHFQRPLTDGVSIELNVPDSSLVSGTRKMRLPCNEWSRNRFTLRFGCFMNELRLILCR